MTNESKTTVTTEADESQQDSPRSTALSKLRQLAKRDGTLRIITATHRCLGGSPTAGVRGNGIPSTEAEIAACEAYSREHGNRTLSNRLADPSHYVVHDVVEIGRPNSRGHVEARSKEGDRCIGYPENLLTRLLEAGPLA